VQKYHKKFRFWNIPEQKSFWQQLIDVGGENILINTDHPELVIEFFDE